MTKNYKQKLKEYGCTDEQIKQAEDQNKKERTLLIITILNWIVVILSLIKIILRYC